MQYITVKYVVQTKQGHIFDIKNYKNATLARHFASHREVICPLHHISVQGHNNLKVYQGKEAVGLDTELKNFNPQWPKYHRLKCDSDRAKRV